MEENHQYHLHQPLINTTTPQEDDEHIFPSDLSSSSNSNWSIVFRLSFLFFIAMVSVWANQEASKGFAITVINESSNTFSGKRFQLFYVSNDEATRIVVKSSKIIEDFLYPDSNCHKKHVNHVILKLVGHNMSDEVVLDSDVDGNKFVININPLIMEGTNFKHDMLLALRLGISRVWLWDGHGKAPKHLTNGIVEYVTNQLGEFGKSSKVTETPQGLGTSYCWNYKDSKQMADFLKYCEGLQPGFIARLNQAMKDGWNDDQLDVALGLPVQDLCTSYEFLRENHIQCTGCASVSHSHMERIVTFASVGSDVSILLTTYERRYL